MMRDHAAKISRTGGMSHSIFLSPLLILLRVVSRSEPSHASNPATPFLGGEMLGLYIIRVVVLGEAVSWSDVG
jgi:hypothetical protein